MKQTIYLDYAAATPVDRTVLRVMDKYHTKSFYNPSSNYLAAKKVNEDLNQARNQIARILGCKPSEFIFTAGGSEANNLALLGVAGTVEPGHIVTSAIEHDSVLETLKSLKSKGWSISFIKPSQDGTIDPKEVEKAVTKHTVLVSIMYANNEVGTIQPIKQIAQKIKQIRQKRQVAANQTPLYFHSDACQAVNYLDLHVHRLGVDMMTLNGGKIYGPKQTGGLFVASNISLTPIVFGGGQERNLRSGTQNVAGQIGFALALAIAQESSKSEANRLGQIQKHFIAGLQKISSSVAINGSTKHRLPNNIHLSFPGFDNERLLFALDEAGVQCSVGSACSASSEATSHVLLAMGMTDDQARSSLRFTLGRQTSLEQIDQTLGILQRLVS